MVFLDGQVEDEVSTTPDSTVFSLVGSSNNHHPLRLTEYIHMRKRDLRITSVIPGGIVHVIAQPIALQNLQPVDDGLCILMSLRFSSQVARQIL